MHTTFELLQAVLQDPILAPVMQGVFPRDKLPIVNKYPSGLIANTDPHDQPGTHWIAMYFISPWESEFFDSYGSPPDTYGMDGYMSEMLRGTTTNRSRDLLQTLLEATVYFIYFIEHAMLIWTLFKLNLGRTIHCGMMHK